MLETVGFYWSSALHELRSKGPFFTAKDYPDLTGKNWVVTGATGGIGLELAKILISKNANVWIVGRNAEKLSTAIDTLNKVESTGKAESVTIDYNDLATVKPGAEQIAKSAGRLDGIIHNAGVMNVPAGSKTKQGYEQQFGVNNLATQLLQDFLDPIVENTEGGRIVWLSSSAHTMSPSDGYDIAATEAGSLYQWAFYGQTKALNYIQAVQWTIKHPSSSVKAIAAHPGIIRTDLSRTTSGVTARVVSALQYDVSYGVHSPIFAALSPDAVNNDYIVPWGRPGIVRPDIKRGASGEPGEKADGWIEKLIQPYK